MLFRLKLFGVTYTSCVWRYTFYTGVRRPSPLRKGAGGLRLVCVLAVLLIGCLCGERIWAQQITDTISGKRLNEVFVTGTAKPAVSRTTSPLQVLQGEDLEKINAFQVSDVIKYFSGVQVKDFGGVGGLKTVSIRSLGANYTNVSYDGIAAFDYQTGQMDLGRFSLENVDMVSLTIGESDDIFQTARVQSSAGVLNIVNRLLSPADLKKTELKTSFKAGSFGLINPSVLFGKVLSRTFSMNASVEWVKTKGNYPFTEYYDYSKDSSAVKNRNNSDVDTWKMEANLSGRFRNGGKLFFKTYYYDSDRGLSGPAIMYTSYSGERTHDRNFFTQGNYTQSLNDRIDFQANARFGYSHIDYENITNSYVLENVFFQREYYANATIRWKVNDFLSFSWANDGSFGNLASDLSDCVYPSRITWLSAFSGKYERNRLTVMASLLNNYTDDHAKKATDPGSQNHLSPYVGFSLKPLDDSSLRFRGYYKNTFRLATFGDLYFSKYSSKLKPENASQYDLGLTWVYAFGNLFPCFSFSADAYLNRIENKIIALPTRSMFVWSVQNYGRVEIRGVDLNAELQARTGKLLWQVDGTYTYQQVVDKTDSQSKTYNQQLPYTPHHSGSGRVSLETPWVQVNYTLLYCGKRYYELLNRSEYRLDPYLDQGISLSRTFDWKNNRISFSAECLNLMDEQYTVVRSYPMPGRSFRFGVKFIY